jgi:hypothetical protein
MMMSNHLFDHSFSMGEVSPPEKPPIEDTLLAL